MKLKQGSHFSIDLLFFDFSSPFSRKVSSELVWVGCGRWRSENWKVKNSNHFKMPFSLEAFRNSDSNFCRTNFSYCRTTMIRTFVCQILPRRPNNYSKIFMFFITVHRTFVELWFLKSNVKFNSDSNFCRCFRTNIPNSKAFYNNWSNKTFTSSNFSLKLKRC